VTYKKTQQISFFDNIASYIYIFRRKYIANLISDFVDSCKGLICLFIYRLLDRDS